MRFFYLYLAFSISACQPFFYFGTFSNQNSNYLEKAAELTNAKEYDKAIEIYRKHIDYRLALKDRPEWENPYFYLLLIGDLYLQQANTEKALESLGFSEQDLRRELPVFIEGTSEC